MKSTPHSFASAFSVCSQSLSSRRDLASLRRAIVGRGIDVVGGPAPVACSRLRAIH